MEDYQDMYQSLSGYLLITELLICLPIHVLSLLLKLLVLFSITCLDNFAHCQLYFSFCFSFDNVLAHGGDVLLFLFAKASVVGGIVSIPLNQQIKLSHEWRRVPKIS